MLASWEIRLRFKKAARTVQSRLWFLKGAKDEFYLTYRRMRRVPAEPFFYALRLIAERFEGSYIDVGANIGQSIEAIKLFAPLAKIYSFEPNPNLAARLKQRYIGDDRVDVRSCALSSHSGLLKLYVPSYWGFVYDGLGSLDYESARSWICHDTVYWFRSDRLMINEYECAVQTLDAQNIHDPVFIKIDVQGSEREVVKGAVATLREHEPILLIEDLHLQDDILATASSLGYEPYTFDGRGFAPGLSDTSSFLITRARIKTLQRVKA